MEKVKIGFLPLYVKLYDDYSPQMRPRIEAFAEEIKALLGKRDDVEVYASDICRLENEFAKAVSFFEENNVDAIVSLHLAYSPSLESEKALKNTKLPIVILDTTPNFAFTDDDDNGAITYNHGIHGVQDMCNLLVRNNKTFYVEAGHYLESDVLDRVIRRVKGIKVAANFRKAKVGTIGGAFAGMGDFCVSDCVYEEIGIERVNLLPSEAKEYFASVTEAEIDALIEEDKENYDISCDIPEDFLRNAAKGGLAVRKWLEDKGLTAFTANFLEVKKNFGIAGMPFAEANRAMARGVGYAGEGDVLTAAFTGALMSVSQEASFIEMFCPDWKNNLIYISHMGEMNVALSVDKPKYLMRPMAYSDVDTTWICGTYKEGEATLINLVPLADGKFRVISSFVNMRTPKCDKFRGSSTSGWFEPKKKISSFLEDFSTLGGTHHLSLMYGDMRKLAEAFAKAMGYEYFEI